MVATLVTNKCGAFKAGIADASTALEGLVEIGLVSVNMDLNEARSMLAFAIDCGRQTGEFNAFESAIHTSS